MDCSGEGGAPEEAAPAEQEPQRPPKKRKKPSKGQKAAEKTPEPVADMSPGADSYLAGLHVRHFCHIWSASVAFAHIMGYQA